MCVFTTHNLRALTSIYVDTLAPSMESVCGPHRYQSQIINWKINWMGSQPKPLAFTK